MDEAATRVRQFVGDVRRRWRLRLGLRAAGVVAACAAVPLLALGVSWRTLGPADGWLIGGAAAAVAAAGLVLLRGVLRRPRTPGERQIARFVEEWVSRTPGLAPFEDALVTAVDAARHPGGGPGFAPLVIDGAAARLASLDPADVVPSAALRRAAVVCGAGVGLLSLAAAFAARPVADAVFAARLRWDPGALELTVAPGDVRIAAGQPLTIRASIRAGGRMLGRLAPELRVIADGAAQTVAMQRAGDGFEVPIPSVDRSFEYVVTAARTRSRTYAVTALVPPGVARIDAHYEYPAFTALPPRDEQGAGDLFAPKGTRVRLTIHADTPVVGGVLLPGADGGAPAGLRVTGDRQLETVLDLTKNGSYRLRLAGRNGLTADDTTEYFIRLMDDRPPTVRISRPGADSGITPLEEVTIEARADDDYGIQRLELVYAVAGGPERVVPFEHLEGAGATRQGSRLLHAEALGVQPGDVISYYARATDVARGKPAATATSDMFFLEVKPFDEEFVLAQSQAMSGQGDPQLESLIDAQKQIIAGTWNLERRSGAGRSAADARALADAQRELKTRVERTLRRPTSRSLGLAPQQIGFQPSRRPPASGAVAEAAVAMGEAAGELDGSRTGAALPHEMNALRALLRAQAEIRRRQVLQQANGGSGGGYGRQGQDLSALFDKELQRQQRTNYETRAQVEERPAPQTGSALDRIRDLARRQEDLARRQQAAEGLPPDALRRELEKLEREQARLRNELEALERQLRPSQSATPQPGGSQSRGSQSGAPGTSPSGRSGTSQSGASAAPGASRPGEQGTSPSRGSGGSDPAAARDEATRQAGGAGGASPADAGGASGGEETGNGAAQARRALEQMRRAADRLRAGSAAEASQSGARAAEQLREAARAAGSAAGEAPARSSGASGREAEELSARLDESRAIRDRLDALQRQIEALEAARQAGAGRAGQGARGAEKAPGAGTGRGGEAGRGANGRSGQDGDAAATEARLGQLRAELGRELQRARDLLSRGDGTGRQSGGAGATPEEHQWSTSAPGNEAFKQDRSDWESLRKDIDAALERYDDRLSQRLAKTAPGDRLRTGGSDRPPDAYGEAIARYYESLARARH